MVCCFGGKKKPPPGTAAAPNTGTGIPATASSAPHNGQNELTLRLVFPQLGPDPLEIRVAESASLSDIRQVTFGLYGLPIHTPQPMGAFSLSDPGPGPGQPGSDSAEPLPESTPVSAVSDAVLYYADWLPRVTGGAGGGGGMEDEMAMMMGAMNPAGAGGGMRMAPPNGGNVTNGNELFRGPTDDYRGRPQSCLRRGRGRRRRSDGAQ